ncbi:MAG TPA: wax ester/triacylglycerol synthase family O-acyltransferase [Candidatus Binatia bacterium]|nr:wax ester/triacylglycerol synthase family O-acyltransferase [Candidatus Binatia bacterium]
MPHLEHLTDADIRFLAQEARAGHAHIGWVMVVEGPPPTYADLLTHVKARLHLVPRHRQKLAHLPLPLARPLWIDDPRFNLDYHVRHTALPSPGSVDKLRALTGRIFSQRLDHSKPLWELWLVQGCENGRCALIYKAHNVVGDRGAGADIINVLFDPSREPRAVPPPERAWIAQPEPTAAELVAASVRAAVNAPVRAAEEAWAMLRDSARARHTLETIAEGTRAIAGAYLDPPSPTPLNVPIGTHRDTVWLRRPLADFKVIKDALGGTINDVYIAAVAGAVRRWLEGRRIEIHDLTLRAAVPITLRETLDDGRGTHRIVECLAPLPVDRHDPIERLQEVRRALRGLKTSRHALGARAIATLQNFGPAALLAQASRLDFSTRRFNLVATNIPGPQFPLYLLGREIVQIGPIGTLVEHCALGIVLVSYNGMLEFGLTGDADALPDLDTIRRDLDLAIDELLEAAGGRSAPPRRRRKPRARQETQA